MQDPYVPFDGYEYSNNSNVTISTSRQQLYSPNQVYVDSSSIYGNGYNYYDSSSCSSSIINNTEQTHMTHMMGGSYSYSSPSSSSSSSPSPSSHTMIEGTGYYSEYNSPEMCYSNSSLLSAASTPFAVTETPYLVASNGYNNGAGGVSYYPPQTSILQTPISVLNSYDSQSNATISNISSINSAKSEAKAIIPIMCPSFMIPSQNAYTNGMNKTEYEIEAYVAKCQYKVLTQQNMLYTLRKIVDVWYDDLNKSSNSFFYNLDNHNQNHNHNHNPNRNPNHNPNPNHNHNNYNNDNDYDNDFVPDVIIQEIVSFIEENTTPFVNMNAVRHLSGKDTFCYEINEQSLGQLILRNERNLYRIYSNKKSSKWIGEDYDRKTTSGSLFHTWESAKTNGSVHSLWYDCSESVQINGICIFRAGKVLENAKYINIYIADSLFKEMKEYCRLSVENLDGWICFTDLNITCRYIKLVFDGIRASVDQLLFI